jgi:ketosteroid isomerase-like protein
MVTDEVRKAIDANNRRFSEGFLKGDASITASVFAGDAVVFPPDAPMIQGRESIEEFWRTVMASGVKEVELTTIELSGSGDYLHERGTGILRVRPPGGTPAEQKIKFVVVWKHTADGWKNIWDIWNASP